ncbi:MAG: hypothetical protein J6T24_04255 [Clostridia bacterium]|nr:hypothetical protein [Clostridia bacterium]
MTERIRELARLTMAGQMYAKPRKTEFDPEDAALPRQERESRRLCQYIRNQEPMLTEYSAFTGYFNFDGSVVGDAFRRGGHKAFEELRRLFHLKTVDGFSTFEWQHATADYAKVLTKGIYGLIEEIDASLARHTDTEEVRFLEALRRVAEAMIAWADKCADRTATFAEGVKEGAYKENLLRLSAALRRVPAHAPETFYEAVLTIYVCFSADPDSVGTLDRYLAPFYERDLGEGRLTRKEAAEYLQELFLMLQAATSPSSPNFTRTAESHFCVGGYLPNGEDAFSELSALIVESLIELPSYIPQVSLRWTGKTPREVFRFMLDCERRDPRKRIAFQNDEKRVKCYTEICHIPFEKAVSYTTVGCNEPAFLGAITGSNSKVNFLRPMETVMHEHREKVEAAESYDEFFTLFCYELRAALDTAFAYDNFYNARRAEDINYISSLFFNDCIENARSLTRGGGNTVIASPMCIGITNVIDSLAVVKQFVFDERAFTMRELLDALAADWVGYEDMRTLILKRGHFFGNDDDTSNGVARALYRELYEFLKERTNLFGYHFLVGDLIGYHPHHKWFGEGTLATPDGRRKGDALKFGLGQSEGRDREGLSALLHAIATADPTGIGCGSTVTNLLLDEKLMRDEENFEKTVDLLLTYFKSGGVHFQLNYVSREDLLAARATPEDHKSLRVRVSGFSECFVKLPEPIQDDVIARTVKR